MSRGPRRVDPARPVTPGTVFLVGAGPGDPSLLTRRGAALLRRADVVVYDALLDTRVLDLAPERAERIHVGKWAGGGTPQEAIHRILLEAARRSRVVVRLKGGDPYVFGRGGEEALALREAGIPFEVVPGVTAALGAAAAAGIPLTHRGIATSVSFVTGTSGVTPEIDPALVARQGTQVFYMALNRLDDLVGALLEAGVAPETPAAAVQWATRPEQRVVEGTVGDLAPRVRAAGLGSPTVIIVGEVVSLRSSVDWWSDRPLSGRRFVVARARAQSSRLSRLLSAAGAQVREFPNFEVCPPPSPAALRRAIRLLHDHDGVVLTSVPGAEALLAGLAEQDKDARALAGLRVLAFGRTTVRSLQRHGVRPDASLSSFDPATALRAAGGRRRLRGRKLLHFTRPDTESPICDAFAAAGAVITSVDAYAQVLRTEGADSLREELEAGRVDAVVFASSSSLEGWTRTFGSPLVGRSAVAAIGPSTAATLATAGLVADLVPSDPTVEGLVAELVHTFGHHANPGETDARPAGAPARSTRVPGRA